MSKQERSEQFIHCVSCVVLAASTKRLSDLTLDAVVFIFSTFGMSACLRRYNKPLWCHPCVQTLLPWAFESTSAGPLNSRLHIQVGLDRPVITVKPLLLPTWQPYGVCSWTRSRAAWNWSVISSVCHRSSRPHGFSRWRKYFGVWCNSDEWEQGLSWPYQLASSFPTNAQQSVYKSV